MTASNTNQNSQQGRISASPWSPCGTEPRVEAEQSVPSYLPRPDLPQLHERLLHRSGNE